MKNRININLDTYTKVKAFVEIASTTKGDVYLCDAYNTFRVDGKSILGTILAYTEWSSIICEYDVTNATTFESRLRKESII